MVVDINDRYAYDWNLTGVNSPRIPCNLKKKINALNTLYFRTEGVISKKTIYGYVILVVAAVGHNPNHALFYRKKGCFFGLCKSFLYITKPYYSCSLLLFF